MLASEAFSNDAFVLGGLGGGWEVVTVLFSGREEEEVGFASVVAGLVGRGGYEYSNGGWVRTSKIYLRNKKQVTLLYPP